MAEGGYRSTTYLTDGPFWALSAPQRMPASPPRPAARYDVAIVGGGFTGLWAARHLLDREPGISVAVLDANYVGFGASGRNAGYLTNRIDHSPHALLQHGVEAGRAMHLAAEGSVREVIGFIKDAAIDCDLREVPMLIVSTNPTCDRRVRRDLAAAEKMGLTCYSALSRSELRERVNSPLLSSGYEDHVSGLVNPLKLVRGLADHLVSRGLSLFEHTPVRSLDTRSRPLALRTPTGTVSADRVLLARNAWSAQHRPFRRMVTPFYVYQAVTEPLSEADWRSVGWRGGEGVLDRRYFLIDFRPTADGRILFGGRDARQPYAARISASLDRSPAVLRLLRESFEQTFPQLRGLKFESFYGGPIAMTPNLLPQVGTLGDGRLAYSHGYCGHGMAQSNFCARIAVDLLMDRQNEDVSLPFVNRSLRGYPPEPLRWLGGWAARAEGRWNDDAAQLGRVSRDEPRLLKLAKKLFA